MNRVDRRESSLIAMNGPGLPVSIVAACIRDGRGGSPTAVLDGAPLSAAQRRGIPAALGVSHVVFISAHDHGVSVRFCTAKGDLPACGHGTVAALAVLADRAGSAEYRVAVHAAGQILEGLAICREGLIDADPALSRAACPGYLRQAGPGLGRLAVRRSGCAARGRSLTLPTLKPTIPGAQRANVCRP